MTNRNTRRGKTQENKNVVINKSHSRGILSGISLIPSRCSDLIKTNALCYNNTDAGDPRLHPSGMTPNLMGFTLIELLVVVLIIGILAAVAVPQYNKAVKKAEVAEARVALDALKKGVSAYYLENGTYEGITADNLGVTMPELKHFKYQVGTGSCGSQPGSTTFPSSLLPPPDSQFFAAELCSPDSKYGIKLEFKLGKMSQLCTTGDRNLCCKQFGGKLVPAEQPWLSPVCTF